MKNTIIATLALVASAGLSWAGAPEGKEVYTAKCAPCHGANGEGKAAIAKMYNVTQAPLASKEVQAKTDDQLKAGHPQGAGKNETGCRCHRETGSGRRRFRAHAEVGRQARRLTALR